MHKSASYSCFIMHAFASDLINKLQQCACVCISQIQIPIQIHAQLGDCLGMLQRATFSNITTKLMPIYRFVAVADVAFVFHFKRYLLYLCIYNMYLSMCMCVCVFDFHFQGSPSKFCLLYFQHDIGPTNDNYPLSVFGPVQQWAKYL